jgi:hypothetical protein
MDNVARKHEARAVHQEYAEVVSAGDALELSTSTGAVVARRAASCLLVPEVGDRVLVAMETRGDAYVLAVLDRRDEGKATLEISGDVVMRASERLSIAASQGVDVVGGTAVRIAARSVEVTSFQTRLASHALEVVGEAVGAELGRVKLLAKSVDGMMERLSQRVKRSFRFVEETEQVKARHLSYSAEEVAHFRGETTVVSASDLVKVNGEQIHVG